MLQTTITGWGCRRFCFHNLFFLDTLIQKFLSWRKKTSNFRGDLTDISAKKEALGGVRGATYRWLPHWFEGTPRRWRQQHGPSVLLQAAGATHALLWSALESPRIGCRSFRASTPTCHQTVAFGSGLQTQWLLQQWFLFQIKSIFFGYFDPTDIILQNKNKVRRVTEPIHRLKLKHCSAAIPNASGCCLKTTQKCVGIGEYSFADVPVMP